MTKKLDFKVINHKAEYEACIFRLETLRNMRVEEVIVYGNSMLVMKQISEEWEVKEDKLKVYWDYSITVLLSFSQYKFVHLP